MALLDFIHAAPTQLNVAVAVRKLTDSDSVTQFRRTDPLFADGVLSAHLGGQLL